ncbi:ABC transporter ATP-binding protein [Streptomyces sp. GS7]|uniref:ABC transporter ATP-binding protein n=1 Tax=Streptomyces sp. GS7 TaxID=2692234 RepID=UPI0013180BE6|nr:ATP-binding cassette domain-containing protein [Streptomyces sp. GS7]QHC25459.1 ATP-binding cassette domain-containing protein [Streptomyces sp. GS7]
MTPPQTSQPRSPNPHAGRVIAALDGVGVRRHTTGQVVLDGIDWTVRSGEHWALLGANGAGKTTVLRLIGALMFPTVGTVEVLGHRLGSVDLRELRAVIGLVSSAQKVPQDATGHTVVLTGATGTVQPLWRRYDAATRERAHGLLAELDCKELADRPFGVCSGGQRARILIARALMAGPPPATAGSHPRLLLLDEPFNALDLPSREDLIDALHRLALNRPELATVTVTHHLEELSPAVDHAVLLREGRVQARGPLAEVLTGERMTACFGRPIEVSRHEGRWLARSGRNQGLPGPVPLDGP